MRMAGSIALAGFIGPGTAEIDAGITGDAVGVVFLLPGGRPRRDVPGMNGAEIVDGVVDATAGVDAVVTTGFGVVEVTLLTGL